MLTDSRLLECDSPDWLTEMAFGSQIRTFLSLEVVVSAVPSLFHGLVSTMTQRYKLRQKFNF